MTLQEQQGEAELIAAILAGETQLYHDLIRPYERPVYLLALSYMKNETDAEDVTQEAGLLVLLGLLGRIQEAISVHP